MLNKAHIPIINNLRGVAALAVCLFHFIYSTINYVSDQTTLKIAYYGQFGVTLFFVISGVVIPLSLLKSNYSIHKWPKFFLKRIIRIEPPYLVALITSIIIILMKQNFLNDFSLDFNFLQIGLHLGYLIPFFKEYNWINEVFWTLAIEFQYYFLISFLILLVIKGKLFGRLLFYLIMLAMPFCFIDTNFFPPYSALFLMGVVWSFYYLNKIKQIELVLVLVTSFFVVYFRLAPVEAVLGVFAIATIHFFNKYSIKTLDFFGNISYSLYLIHPLIGGSLINILSHSFFLSWQKPIVILLGLVVTILSSFIMYKLVEKPSQLLSKRITY